MTSPTNVLFVCLHGAAKSVIAAEYLERLGAQHGIRFAATAAGVEPDADIPANVVASLLAEGMDVRGRQPIAVDSHMVENADWIVSFGCDLPTTAPATAAVIEWSDVPAVSDDYVTARDEIVRRLNSLVEEMLARPRAR